MDGVEKVGLFAWDYYGRRRRLEDSECVDTENGKVSPSSCAGGCRQCGLQS
jgi:hypothetical protein